MFEKYMGRNQGAIFTDPLTRRGCELWLKRVLGYYGEKGGVDVEIIDDQLGLCEKTAEYIYSEFTPTTLRYVPGSRPLLEAVVREVVRSGMSDDEKALAIMRRCRDNQDRGLARPDLFQGGTEEELLKRGAIMCNEISRVFVCLCQIAGLPARTFSAHISGHMMAEVMTNGKWRWIDPMKGLAPVKDNGEPASAWDLCRDPKLFERQPKRVWDDCRPPKIVFGTKQRNPRNLALTMVRNRDCYFHPKEAWAVGNYFVWEHAKYTYPWRIEPADPKGLAEARRLEALNRRKLGWPDHYFVPQLLEEKLKLRRK
ncbi:MAG: transglutaminase-like domain-containing protein [Kiritimatiellia bacterium]